MNINDKINNIREAVKNNELLNGEDNKIFNAILDVLLDLNNEINELNEMIFI